MAPPDESDVAELFGYHAPALLRSARALLRSDADAEDAVQDAVVAVLSAPHVLAVIQEAGAWLYTVVRRRCVDILRRDGRARADERETALEELFDEAPDAEELLEQREIVAAVAAAVRDLDEPLRFAFVENALAGRPFREIAEASGIPMGTLMARKQRAVELIKQALISKGLFALHPNKEENDP